MTTPLAPEQPTNDLHLEECPFCKSEDHCEIITTTTYYGGEIVVHVECGECGMRGPTFSSEDLEPDVSIGHAESAVQVAAVSFWNHLDRIEDKGE